MPKQVLTPAPEDKTGELVFWETYENDQRNIWHQASLWWDYRTIKVIKGEVLVKGQIGDLPDHIIGQYTAPTIAILPAYTQYQILGKTTNDAALLTFFATGYTLIDLLFKQARLTDDRILNIQEGLEIGVSPEWLPAFQNRSLAVLEPLKLIENIRVLIKIIRGNYPQKTFTTLLPLRPIPAGNYEELTEELKGLVTNANLTIEDNQVILSILRDKDLHNHLDQIQQLYNESTRLKFILREILATDLPILVEEIETNA